MDLWIHESTHEHVHMHARTHTHTLTDTHTQSQPLADVRDGNQMQLATRAKKLPTFVLFLPAAQPPTLARSLSLARSVGEQWLRIN